jgi:phosphoglycerol geranylgeranyltransferase
MRFLFQDTSSKLAVLIDPDKFNADVVMLANTCHVHCFLVGGSGKLKHSVTKTITRIKKLSSIPIILFPGDETQLSKQADGLLLLSLLSGRNPEYLIEKHVKAAPIIKKMNLPFLPTAYLLVGKAKTSTTQKITETKPLTEFKTIINTTLAAEQLGFKAIYLEAGSGASKAIPAKWVKQLKKIITIPIIVGGGIDSAAKAQQFIHAGANLIVVGNALEKNPLCLIEISSIFKHS